MNDCVTASIYLLRTEENIIKNFDDIWYVQFGEDNHVNDLPKDVNYSISTVVGGTPDLNYCEHYLMGEFLMCIDSDKYFTPDFYAIYRKNERNQFYNPGLIFGYDIIRSMHVDFPDFKIISKYIKNSNNLIALELNC